MDAADTRRERHSVGKLILSIIQRGQFILTEIYRLMAMSITGRGKLWLLLSQLQLSAA